MFNFFSNFQNIFTTFSFHSTHSVWFWWPIAGQFVGGILGGIMYELTIGIHHEVDSKEEEDQYGESQPLKEDVENVTTEEE